MPIYELAADHVQPVEATTFAREGIRERQHLQRLLRESIEVLAPDTLVIAEEFSRWEGSNRRIDLLGVDRAANLVVVELKRTDEGGHMDLQALRYAAMVSPMTFDEAVDTYDEHLRRQGRDDDARQARLDYLGWDDQAENAFNQQVRIVLASMDFDKEITSTVLWLNDVYGLDIRCVRIQPYRLADRLLVDVQQIIPLPEAAEYRVQIQKKVQQERIARTESTEQAALRRAFWEALLAEANKRTALHANISPSQESWVSANRGGFGYQYIIRKHEGKVALYIDRGKGTEAENKAVFNALLAKKEAIETAFGGPLEWVSEEDKRACQVVKTITVGGVRDEAKWPAIHQAMIDAMIRLEAAVRPYLTALSVRREAAPSGTPRAVFDSGDEEAPA